MAATRTISKPYSSISNTDVEGHDLVGFVEEAQALIASTLTLPDGHSLEWGGEFENQQRAAARLMLIALLLFLTFHSVKQTLLTLFLLPIIYKAFHKPLSESGDL